MSFSIGNPIRYTIFGESHGRAIGMSIDGLPAGISIDTDFIEYNLNRRRPNHSFATSRVDNQDIKWLSGITDGVTNGGNLCFYIENKDTHSADYESYKNTPRPSHSDYPAFVKYGGYHDISGGGFFSARLTAAIVTGGSIITSILRKMGIYVQAYVKSIGELKFTQDDYDCNLYSSFSLKEERYKEIQEYISKYPNDAFGGSIRVLCQGIPVGIGEPYFDSMESVLSHYMFSIPAVKGVSFGIGNEFETRRASEIMEKLRMIDGKPLYTTNFNGGILGGLSNGNPIVINLSFRGASSISQSVDTVDLQKKEDVQIKIKGRHDRVFLLRTPVICESMACMGIYNLIMRDVNRKESVQYGQSE